MFPFKRLNLLLIIPTALQSTKHLVDIAFSDISVQAMNLRELAPNYWSLKLTTKAKLLFRAVAYRATCGQVDPLCAIMAE